MLNPSIILQGQAPNVLGAASAGLQLGNQHNQIKQQNALAQYLQTSGADVLSGDAKALNALAQFGPAGMDLARQVQGRQQDVAARDRTFERGVMENDRNFNRGVMESDRNYGLQQRQEARLTRQEQANIQAEAARMSAQQRAEQAARIEGAVAAGLSAQSPEQWDQIVGPIAPDLVGQFENREALAAKSLSIADALKRYDEQNAPPESNEPATVAALRIRAEEAGLMPGTPEYQQFMASGGVPSQSTTMRVGPDGAVEFNQGTGTATNGGNGKSLTVDEGKNTGFLIRAQDSMEVLDALESEGTSLFAKIANGIPVAGNYLQTPEYRQYDQARRDFINAVLRRESGAVISPEEFANAEQQYFPQPGDDPATIAQKRNNRQNAIQGFEIGAGDGVNRIGNNEPQQQQPSVDFSAMSQGDIMNFDVGSASVADLEAWNAKMDELGL